MTAFPAGLLAGCGAAQPPIRVAQYLAQCDALRGKLVSVAGFVECGGTSCTLYPDQSGPETLWRHDGETRLAVYRVRDGLPPNRAAIPAKPPMVDVGGSKTFDRKVQALRSRYVVITGLVDKQSCTGTGGTDRSPGLHPTDIRAWTPSEGAPQNPN